MKTIVHLAVAASLMLSVGTALAGTDIHIPAKEGFHALSQVTTEDTQVMTSLTDEQLGKVVGGLVLNPEDLDRIPEWMRKYVMPKSSYVVTGSQYIGGLGYPNPEDPDRPWGPLGPVVKPTVKMDMFMYRR